MAGCGLAGACPTHPRLSPRDGRTSTRARTRAGSPGDDAGCTSYSRRDEAGPGSIRDRHGAAGRAGTGLTSPYAPVERYCSQLGQA